MFLGSSLEYSVLDPVQVATPAALPRSREVGGSHVETVLLSVESDLGELVSYPSKRVHGGLLGQ